MVCWKCESFCFVPRPRPKNCEKYEGFCTWSAYQTCSIGGCSQGIERRDHPEYIPVVGAQYLPKYALGKQAMAYMLKFNPKIRVNKTPRRKNEDIANGLDSATNNYHPPNSRYWDNIRAKW